MFYHGRTLHEYLSVVERNALAFQFPYQVMHVSVSAEEVDDSELNLGNILRNIFQAFVLQSLAFVEIFVDTLNRANNSGFHRVQALVKVVFGEWGVFHCSTIIE